MEEVIELKRNQAHQLLTMNVGFKKIDLEAISSIFTPEADYGAILHKIMELIDHVKINAGDIADPKKYTIVSLLNAFGGKEV